MRFRKAVARSSSYALSAALVLAVGLFVLAGCGGSSSDTTSSATEAAAPPATTSSSTSSTPAPSSSSSEGAAQTLALAADPSGQLKYDKSSLTAKAGAVSIDFTNQSPEGHNVTIESSSGEEVGATPTFEGGSKTLKVNLKPGTYKFYCSVPGHRQGGMEGTITVQ